MAEFKSPGGFVFGIQGWSYGEVRPRTITFFMDGTTRVCDHHGNEIREYSKSHGEAIAALKDAGIDWQRLDAAGWPQLPYDELKELVVVPPTPLDELAKIRNKALRLDAMKLRREIDAALAEEAETELVG